MKPSPPEPICHWCLASSGTCYFPLVRLARSREKAGAKRCEIESEQVVVVGREAVWYTWRLGEYRLRHVISLLTMVMRLQISVSINVQKTVLSVNVLGGVDNERVALKC